MGDRCWSGGGCLGGCLGVEVRIASGALDHGIPIDRAIDWHQNGFYAHEATCLYDAHWAPTDARTIRDHDHTFGDIDEWAATGLPANSVTAYLRAGIHVDEVGALRTRQVDLTLF